MVLDGFSDFSAGLSAVFGALKFLNRWKKVLKAKLAAPKHLQDALPANRYGTDTRLPHFNKDEHVPVLAPWTGFFHLPS